MLVSRNTNQNQYIWFNEVFCDRTKMDSEPGPQFWQETKLFSKCQNENLSVWSYFPVFCKKSTQFELLKEFQIFMNIYCKDFVFVLTGASSCKKCFWRDWSQRRVNDWRSAKWKWCLVTAQDMTLQEFGTVFTCRGKSIASLNCSMCVLTKHLQLHHTKKNVVTPLIGTPVA